MARACHCCNSEFLTQINAKLRAGESQTAIAQTFGLSPDSVQRHSKHLDVQVLNEDAGLRELYQRCYARADELFKACSMKGSDRAAIDSLSQCVDILDRLSRLQISKTGFESLSLSEKVALIRADGPLFLAIIDSIVHDADFENGIREVEQKHGKFMDNDADNAETTL